jgi:hypothetical protein|nr:MAG TPA: Metal binding domain of Ada [Caudoviricetes sp.]
MRKKLFFITIGLTTLMACGICCYALNDYKVAYNQKSHIYHNVGCEWARKCTQNCIFIMKSQAINRGGQSCKVCGG